MRLKNSNRSAVELQPSRHGASRYREKRMPNHFHLIERVQICLAELFSDKNNKILSE